MKTSIELFRKRVTSSFILYLIFVLVTFIGNSQVSTSVEKRKPVLIDITGMKCTPCGDLSLWLDDYLAINSDVTLIGVHGSGSYATPSTPFDIDMRCDDANTIASDIVFNVNGALGEVVGFPTVVLDGNRTNLSEISQKCEITRQEDSYVNMDLVLNEQTRELSIEIEMYFVEDAPSEVFLSVGVLQDDLFGYQQSQPGSITGNFTFNHVLRDMITNAFGNSLGTPVQGQTIEESFVYTIPEFIEFSSTTVGQDPELLINDLSIFSTIGTSENVIFNGESRVHQTIETGVIEHLQSSTSVHELEQDSFNVFPNPIIKGERVGITVNQSLFNVKIKVTDLFGRIIESKNNVNLEKGVPSFFMNTQNWA